MAGTDGAITPPSRARRPRASGTHPRGRPHRDLRRRRPGAGPPHRVAPRHRHRARQRRGRGRHRRRLRHRRGPVDRQPRRHPRRHRRRARSSPAATGPTRVWLDDTGDGGRQHRHGHRHQVDGLDTFSGVDYLGVRGPRPRPRHGPRHPDRAQHDRRPAAPTITTGNDGNDTVLLQSVSGPTDVKLGNGNDVVRIGNRSPGRRLSAIRACVKVSGDAGDDRVEVVGTADTDLLGILSNVSLPAWACSCRLRRRSGPTGSRRSPSSAPSPVASPSPWAARRRASSTTTPPPPRSPRPSRRCPRSAPATCRSPRPVAAGPSATSVRWPAPPAGEAALTMTMTPLGLAAQPGSTVVSGIQDSTDGLVDYDGFETFTLGLGSGDDVLLIDSTIAGTTTVNLGAGDDRAFVETTGGPTAVNGQGGDDYLVINAITSPTSPTASGRAHARRRRRQRQLLRLPVGRRVADGVRCHPGSPTSSTPTSTIRRGGGHHQRAGRQRQRLTTRSCCASS